MRSQLAKKEQPPAGWRNTRQRSIMANEANLTPAQEAIVLKFESEYQRINSAILSLENERAQLLSTFDEEYAQYRDHYAAYYADEPLSIRRYYLLANEYREISDQWNELQKEIHASEEPDYRKLDEFDRAHAERMSYLERLLGA
jgi:hypothetical protein